jgi:hypothetical protein
MTGVDVESLSSKRKCDQVTAKNNQDGKVCILNLLSDTIRKRERCEKRVLMLL